MSDIDRPVTRAAVATLVALTTLNFLNYIDRYVMAAVANSVGKDAAFAGTSDAALGFLQTAFLITLMVVSPLAGVVGRRVERRWIVAAGVAVWSAATVASGLARNYHELVAARVVTGFGEASYATVAPAILSDIFRPGLRGRVLSVFYLATPVGSALGFVLGGKMTVAHGWRSAFLLAGAPGLVFALGSLLVPEPRRGAMDEAGERARVAEPLAVGLRRIAGSRDYVVNVVGSVLWVWSIGGLSFWLPTYFQESRGLDPAQANLAVGGITVVAGIAGTALGGFVGDAWARKDPGAYLKLSGLGLLVAAPLVALGPYVSLRANLALALVAEIAVFLNTGPLNTVMVTAVPPSVRELAVGLYVLAIHAFGDANAPTTLGAFVSLLRRHGLSRADGLRAAVAVTAVPLVFGGLVLLVGGRRRR